MINLECPHILGRAASDWEGGKCLGGESGGEWGTAGARELAPGETQRASTATRPHKRLRTTVLMSSTSSKDPLAESSVLFNNAIKTLPSILGLPVYNDRANMLSL